MLCFPKRIDVANTCFYFGDDQSLQMTFMGVSGISLSTVQYMIWQLHESLCMKTLLRMRGVGAARTLGRVITTDTLNT